MPVGPVVPTPHFYRGPGFDRSAISPSGRQRSDLMKRQSSMVALVHVPVIAIPLAFRRAAPFGSRAEDARAGCRL
jgi:hypothetical protein